MILFNPTESLFNPVEKPLVKTKRITGRKIGEQEDGRSEKQTWKKKITLKDWKI